MLFSESARHNRCGFASGNLGRAQGSGQTRLRQVPSAAVATFCLALERVLSVSPLVYFPLMSYDTK